MVKRVLVALAAVAMLASIALAGDPRAANIPLITAEELKAEMDAGKKLVLVDARTAQEYNEGHIKKAINIPPDDRTGYAAVAGLLPKDKNYPVIFYCRGYS